MAKKEKQPIGKLPIKHYGFLKRLARTKSDKKRRKLINSATKEQLLVLIEISTNLLSNFNLTKRQKQKLLPFAPLVRKLARIRSEGSARKFLEQRGSGLPFAAILTPVLIEAASHLISKIAKNGSSSST
jgi:hypothetical protein